MDTKGRTTSVGAAIVAGALVAGAGVAQGATASAGTVIDATVAEVLTVTAPADFAFGSQLPGAQPTRTGQALNVVSNGPLGYTLSADATSPVGGVLPMQLQVQSPGPAGFGITPPFSAYTDLTGTAAQIGARPNGITPAPPAGDAWTIDFRTQPIPYAAAGTLLRSTVTFTVVSP